MITRIGSKEKPTIVFTAADAKSLLFLMEDVVRANNDLNTRVYETDQANREYVRMILHMACEMKEVTEEE
jgi:hypothetical protein